MKHDYKPVATLCFDKVNAHRMIYADAAEGEPLALAAWSFSRRQPQSIEILVIKKILNVLVAKSCQDVASFNPIYNVYI